MMAGTELAQAYLKLIPTLKGSEKQIKSQLSGIDFASSGRKAGKSFANGMSAPVSSALEGIAGKAAGIFAAVGFGQLVSAAADMADATSKFKQTLGFAGIDAATIDKLTESTQEYADQTVYELSDIQNTTAQLAANGVKNYDMLAQAAGNLNAVAGGNKDTFKSVAMVMTQTAGAGKLTTENWNQLANAIPGASGMLQDALKENGAYTGNFRDAMAAGQITAEEFSQAIMDLGLDDAAVAAAKNVSTYEGAFGNLEATVVGGMGKIMTTVQPAVTMLIVAFGEKLAPIFESLNAVAESLMEKFEEYSGVLDGAASASERFQSVLSDMFANIPALVEKLVTALVNRWLSIGQTLVNLLPTLLQTVLSMGSTLFASLVTAIAQVAPLLAQGIADLVAELAVMLPEFVPMLLDAALVMLQAIVDAIPVILPALLDAAVAMIMSLSAMLPELLPAILEAGIKLFFALVQAVEDIKEDVFTAVGDLVMQIPSIIGQFFGDMVDAGKNLINGFIEGLFGGGDDVNNAVGTVMAGAIEKGNATLETHSPSKVFERMGGYTMQGFAIGVKEGASAASKAVDRAVSSTIGSAKASVSVAHTYATASAAGSGTVYNLSIDGATINGDEEMRAVVKSCIETLVRKGSM